MANYGLDENPSNATYAIRFASTPEEIRTLPSKLVHGHPMYTCKWPVRCGILSIEGGFEVEIPPPPPNNKAKYVLTKYILCVNTDGKLFKFAQIFERVTYK